MFCRQMQAAFRMEEGREQQQAAKDALAEVTTAAAGVEEGSGL